MPGTSTSISCTITSRWKVMYLRSVMHRRDYMTKFDLSDFYMHLPMPPESVQYFRFMFEGAKYECLGMPFGLGPAPRIATKFLSPVVKYLRRRGVRCIVYIDDILILSRTRDRPSSTLSSLWIFFTRSVSRSTQKRSRSLRPSPSSSSVCRSTRSGCSSEFPGSRSAVFAGRSLTPSVSQPEAA